MSDKKFKDWSMFSTLFLYAFFFPDFYNNLGSSGAMLINGGLISGLTVYFLALKGICFKFYDRKNKEIFLVFLLIFVFFLLHITLSMFIGMSFGEIDIIQRDFYELHRPALYFLVFAFSFYMFYRDGMILKFERLLLFIFFVLVLFGINQFFGFYDYISQLYTKHHNIRTRRVSAPFANPYDYAFMMSFFILYFLVKFIYVRRIYFLPLVIAFIMLILPQSRSVAGAFLIGFFIILPLVFLLLESNLKELIVRKKLITFSSLFLAAIISFVASISFLLENFPYLTSQFLRLVEGEGIGQSANMRFEQFTFALNKASQNPFILIFGNGPAKSEMEHVESIYTHQFYRYGIVGFLLYFISLIGLGVFFACRILSSIGRHNRSFPFFLTLLLWFLFIPLMSIGNNFTEQVRISFFFYALMGLLASSYSLTVFHSKRTAK